MTFIPKHCPNCGHNLTLETRPIVRNRCPVCGEDVRLAKLRKPWHRRQWEILLLAAAALIIISIIINLDKTKQGQKTKNKVQPPVQDTTQTETVKETKPTPTPAPTPAPTPESKIYKIGDSVQIGEVKYIVTKAPEKMKEIGDQFLKRTASGIFVIVELKAELTGKEPLTIDSIQFRLIDSQDRKFKVNSEGQTALMFSGKEIYSVKQANPNVPITGYAVFDIPEDATSLKLEIRDLRSFSLSPQGVITGFFSPKKEIIDLGI